MGILDDAIREHLDLKRRHGARDSELREIEDDAFGGGERPDPFAAGELFGQTAPSGQPETGSDELAGPSTPAPSPPAGGEEPTRLAGPEAGAAPPTERRPAEPPPPQPPAAEPPPSSPPAAEAPPADRPAAPTEPSGAPEAPAGPPTEEPPSLDRELERAAPERPPKPAAPEPDAGAVPADTGPQAPAPPPDSESLEDLMAQEEAEAPPAPPEGEVIEPGPAEPPAPEPPEGEVIEPGPFEPPSDPGGVPEPPPPPPEPGTEPPGRARGRVHHPTEEWASPPEPPSDELAPPSAEPLEPEGTADVEREAIEAEPELEQPEGPPSSGPLEPEGASSPPPGTGESAPGPALFDYESEEIGFEEPAAPADSDDFAELGPPEDAEYADEEERYDEPPSRSEESVELEDLSDLEEDEEAPPLGDEDPASPSRRGPSPEGPGDEEDLLTESPEFLQADEEADEDLWFEKGPPQDFDFDDDEE